ncbi:S1/P1 nuclease [Syncephalis fuscata]|nr:S1/P1 nuclease [Syncephalis fuscata]
MVKLFNLLSSVCIVGIPLVNAWGKNGHSAVSLLAKTMLTPSAFDDIQKLLNEDPMVKGDFALAATWADKIKRSGGYRWTGVLHYVGMKGDSSDTCHTYTPDDCANGRCIITGMTNFTKQAACNVPAPRRLEAVKFLLHFLGDIAQPLHTTDIERGGNGNGCKWGKSDINLHTVWDSKIIDKNINNDFDGYIETMTNEISQGKYASLKLKWQSCFSKEKPDLNSCFIEWGNESNQFNCNYIFPAYKAAKESGDLDLSRDYYQDNAERVNMFIARAAVRTASYLNAVFGACS